MHIDRLAHTLSHLLTPALPRLVHPGMSGSESRADRGGNGDLASELWEKLEPRINQRASAREAVEDVARKPDDPRASGALELQLEKILTVDDSLAAQVEDLLENADEEELWARPRTEIDDLYQELTDLYQRLPNDPDLKPTIEARMMRLRELQAAEAKKMREQLEARSPLKPGEGWAALHEARRLLDEYEDPASSDSASSPED
jgi:hypothetical protein